jgi:hypothetical protein
VELRRSTGASIPESLCRILTWSSLHLMSQESRDFQKSPVNGDSQSIPLALRGPDTNESSLCTVVDLALSLLPDMKNACSSPVCWSSHATQEKLTYSLNLYQATKQGQQSNIMLPNF